MFSDTGMTSGMSIVIATSAGTYGILAVQTRQRRTFMQNEVNVLQTLANVLGTIIVQGGVSLLLGRFCRRRPR
jgi:signal transduction protein with GAF and PtsI domain